MGWLVDTLGGGGGGKLGEWGYVRGVRRGLGEWGYMTGGCTLGGEVRWEMGWYVGGGGGVRKELVKNAVFGHFLEIYYILAAPG